MKLYKEGIVVVIVVASVLLFSTTFSTTAEPISLTEPLMFLSTTEEGREVKRTTVELPSLLREESTLPPYKEEGKQYFAFCGGATPLEVTVALSPPRILFPVQGEPSFLIDTSKAPSSVKITHFADLFTKEVRLFTSYIAGKKVKWLEARASCVSRQIKTSRFSFGTSSDIPFVIQAGKKYYPSLFRFYHGKRTPKLIQKITRNKTISFPIAREMRQYFSSSYPISVSSSSPRIIIANSNGTTALVISTRGKLIRRMSFSSEGSLVVGKFLSSKEDTILHLDSTQRSLEVYNPINGERLFLTQGVFSGIPVGRTLVTNMPPAHKVTPLPSPTVPLVLAPTPTLTLTPIFLEPSPTVTPFPFQEEPKSTPIVPESDSPLPEDTSNPSVSLTPSSTSFPTATVKDSIPLEKEWKINHPVYKPQIYVDLSPLEQFLTMSDADIRSQITTEGGIGSNVTLRKAAYDLSRAYHKTKNPLYADKTVLILERFSEVVPSWPYLKADKSKVERKNVVPDIRDLDFWEDSGMLSLEAQGPFMDLLLAYDNVADSGAFERRGRNVREAVETFVLRKMIDSYLNLLDGRVDLTNLAPYKINGLIPFGRVLDPSYAHQAIKWTRQLMQWGFFRDGMWHEGSPAYHRQVGGRAAGKAYHFKELYGYSDPVGFHHPLTGERFDNITVEDGYSSYFERTREALRWMTLPNHLLFSNHDSQYTLQAVDSLTPAGESHCLFGARHCLIDTLSPSLQESQVRLDFSGTEGHEHRDMLTLSIFAKGRELVSGGNYTSQGGLTRLWEIATAQHNTLVVDERNSEGRYDDQQPLSSLDLPEGESTYYLTQDDGQGNTNNSGHLLLWDATSPQVSVVEVEGRKAYDRFIPLSLYRRLIAQVQTTQGDFYLLDIFRVAGGTVYDWMIHGDLGDSYKIIPSLTLSPVEKMRFSQLNINRQAESSSDFSWDILHTDGTALHSIMLGAQGTEISIGKGLALRKTGTADYLDIRRSGTEKLFVALHEPYKGRRKVVGVEAVNYTPESAMSGVYLKVSLADGSIDHIGVTADGDSSNLSLQEGNGFHFKGKLAVAREFHGKALFLYGAQAQKVSFNNQSQAGEGILRGDIVEVKRTQRGDGVDAFVTKASLPLGEALQGKTLLLSLPHDTVEGYRIKSVVQEGEEYWIVVEGEPGVEFREQQSNEPLVKYLQYPLRGARGSITFSIPLSVFLTVK